MSDHIVRLLEKSPVSRLSPGDLAMIRTHILVCHDCRRAFDAAQLSGELLRARVAQTAEPSPFFQMRVMAALRDSSRAAAPVTLFTMWKSTATLVSSMIAAAIILLTLTWFNVRPFPSKPLPSASQTYSLNAALFDENDTLSETPMTLGQALAAVYSSEDGYGNYE